MNKNLLREGEVNMEDNRSNLEKLIAAYGDKEALTEATEKDYLVVPGDLAIAKELGFEEDLELTEDLPAPLAKAFKGNWDIPRDSRGRSSNYGGIGLARPVDIDFKNSTYTEITPEKALELYKAGDSKNVFVVFDGKLANTYLENGKRTYDFKATRDYRSDVSKYTKNNGTVGENSMWLTPKEFYNNADHIYIANEVPADKELQSERSQNPESKYSKEMTDTRVGGYSKTRAGLDKEDVKLIGRSLKDTTTATAYINNNNGGPYDDHYNCAAFTVKGGEFTPDFKQARLTQGYNLSDRDFKDLTYWENTAARYASNWGLGDIDTASARYAAKVLADGREPDELLKPIIDWRNFDAVKRAKAELRYRDVEKELTSVKKSAEEAMNKISSVKDSISSAERDRANLPAAWENKKRTYQRYISNYTASINNYMKELLSWQDKLEDADEMSKQELAEMDKTLADLNDKLAKLQADMKNNLNISGSKFFSNKVPESLQESNRIVWSSNATRDYILDLPTREAVINSLIDRGYDSEMLALLDDKGLEDLIKEDDYMWQDDSDEFFNRILPEINKQTHGGLVIALNKDNLADIDVINTEDLISPEFNCDEVKIASDKGDLDVEFYDNDNLVKIVQLFTIPEDGLEQANFVNEIMPAYRESYMNSIGGEDFMSEENFMNSIPDVLLDKEVLEEFIKPDELIKSGVRVKNTLVECLTEAKSKAPSELEIELEGVKADYEDFGPEGFYAVSFNRFERDYPVFTKEVIKTFLREMGILTREELADNTNFEQYWQTGELIYPTDWPCLLEGAEALVSGKGFQWEKVYKKYYKPVDENLTESFVKEWWGQEKPDEEEFAEFGLTFRPLDYKGDETLYIFEGTKKAFDKARDAGYFFSIEYNEDEGHTADLDESIKFDTNGISVFENWTDAYNLFNEIIHKYWPDENLIREKVEELYRLFKGNVYMDEAYRRWHEDDNLEVDN